MQERFKKIVQSLADFVQQTGKTRAVLGLSGGVDSALTAKIAVEALGKDKVTVILMPNEGLTKSESVTDAESFAKALGIEHQIVPINPFLDDYSQLPWKSSELSVMNVNARIRATILYHFANTHDAIVLGTGNKTELMLGYFTKYGDGACDVEVIGSLYKTEVWEMAKAVGVPEVIVNKTPSAELTEGQTDEGEMGMSYTEVDAILRAIESGEKPTGANADRVREMMRTSEHKRHVPPIIHFL